MADKPLLSLPTPETVVIRNRAGGGPDITRPSRARQGVRLDPKFARLTTVMADPARIPALQDDPASIAPERAIVFEVEGGLLEDFYAQAKAIGLEYLGDFESEFASSEDFYETENPTGKLGGRIYLAMPDVQALRELLSLWKHYKEKKRMPNGKGEWGKLFSHLIDVRPWGPQDRIDEDVIAAWREEIAEAPNQQIRLEIELWFHENSEKRAAAFREVEEALANVGGVTVHQATVTDIHYHAVLADVPAAHVQALIDNPNVGLALVDEVMFLRPQSVMRTPISGRAAEAAASAGAQPPRASFVSEQPIAALLDGFPIQNHFRLDGRLIVDDPDNIEPTYSVNRREHGTEMASIIIHGDLSDNEPPIRRPLYVRPVLRPTQSDERTPPDQLLVDVIYQAVRRMKEGTGGNPPVAPNVAVINFSLGDPRRQFARVMSPLGRLLDYLSHRYKVLFLVSAGNVLDRLPISSFRTWTDFENASPQDRERAVLSALNENKSQRTLLSPAEAMNVLTIGAAHHSSVFNGTLQRGHIDPMTHTALPNVISALGLGFKKVIKPDLLFPGGRVPLMAAASGQALLAMTPRAGGHSFGIKAAQAAPTGANIRHEGFTWGTSVATALATRAAHQVHETLFNDPTSNHTGLDPNYVALVLKALLVHGAEWGEKGPVLEQLFGPQGQGAHFERRDNVARLLGYGRPNLQRVLDCTENRATLLGCGSVAPDNALLYRIPLPTDLDGVRAFRALTMTLAWLSPTNPRHQGYRMAALDVSSASEGKYWAASGRVAHQPTDKATMRGTVFHERRSAEQATVFIDDGHLLLRVSCFASAGEFTENIPFALAISFEVGADTGIQVYDQVRARLATRVQAAVLGN